MKTVKGHFPKIKYVGWWDSGRCEVCKSKITPETRVAMFGDVNVHRGVMYTYAHPVCCQCSMIDNAIIEAKINQSRFTYVCVGRDGTPLASYCGPRCACGAASIEKLSLCARCWRESRMLTKAQSEINIIKRMTTQLNRQIKEKTNGAK